MSRILVYSFTAIALATLLVYQIRFERSRPPYELDASFVHHGHKGAVWSLLDLGGGGDEFVQVVGGELNFIIAGRFVEKFPRVYFQDNYTDSAVYLAATYDVDGDGRKEMFFPGRRGNSAYVRVLDIDGREVLTTTPVFGEDTGGTDGVWDGGLTIIGVCDDAETGERLLVTYVNSSYDRYPRGFRMFSLEDGREVSRIEIGAVHAGSALEDGDGEAEVIMSSASPANGGGLNGFDDFHSYLFCMELNGRVKWSHALAGKFAITKFCLLRDRDGRATRIVARVKKNSAADTRPNRMYLVEAATGVFVDSLTTTGLVETFLIPVPSASGNSWDVFCSTEEGFFEKYSVIADRLVFVKARRLTRGRLILIKPSFTLAGRPAFICFDYSGNRFVCDSELNIVAHDDVDVKGGPFDMTAYVNADSGVVIASRFAAGERTEFSRLARASFPWVARTRFVLFLALVGMVHSAATRALRRAKTTPVDSRTLKRLLNITGHGDFAPIQMLEGFQACLDSLASQDRIREAQRESFADDVREIKMVYEDVFLEVRALTQDWNFSKTLRKPVSRAVREFPRLIETLQAQPLALASIRVVLPEIDAAIRTLLEYLKGVEAECQKRHAVDLPPLVEQIIGRMEDKASKQGIELDVTGDWSESCRVWGTAPEVTLVVENLLSNALRALENRPEKKIRIERSDKSYRLALRVGDTGCGMTGAQKDNLFQDGYTTKEDSGGNGLYQSRQIMEENGGCIALLESTEGIGSTFVVEFVKIREKGGT